MLNVRISHSSGVSCPVRPSGEVGISAVCSTLFVEPRRGFPINTPIFNFAPSMDYVLIIHTVKDYPAWKHVFDKAAAMRKEAAASGKRARAA